jgi:subtilase family protein
MTRAARPVPDRSYRNGGIAVRHSRTLVALLVAPLALAGVVMTTPSASAQPDSGVTTTKAATKEHVSCAAQPKAKRTMRCLSVWRTPAGGNTLRAAVTKPSTGYRPADIKSAYGLPSKGGAGQTIAIVDAYDNPKAEANLSYYRKAFKLPACTTANKCFRKVDQRGKKKYPEGDPGWGVEIALDLQAASAACPKCKILLVEADDASYENLGTAVNTAVRLGADVVSNSYGGDEYGADAAFGKKYFYHPHTAVVASSGDYGFTTTSSPAVFDFVWAVGGTSLKKKSGKWRESAWEGAGSGCSAWTPKPSWQKDANCSMRTTSDVSAVADPDTGLAVYDTYGLGEDNGWIVVGGTSLSSPLVAGMIGLAGNAHDAWKPSYAYKHKKGLKDVVGGSNGYCGGDYLCTGVKGYDGPTGLGSPKGIGAL